MPSLARPGLYEEVETQLRRYIVRRGLQPGARLPTEAELAAALGTSRVVVREALRSLEALGLVESRVGSGRYLCAFDVSTAARTFAASLAFHPAALLDLLTVRRAVEVEVVRVVAGRLTEDDLTALADLVEQMRARIAHGASNFPAEDGAFHRRLVGASGNLVALALVDLFWRVMEALYASGFPGPSDLPAVAELHAGVVAALRQGDGAEASNALHSHLQEAEQRFTAWQAAQGGAAGPDGMTTIQAATQAALLWPGMAPPPPAPQRPAGG